MIEVRSPVEDFTGVTAGVVFDAGRAEVDHLTASQAAYFRKAGYTITRPASAPPAPSPAPVAPAAPVVAEATVQVSTPAKKAPARKTPAKKKPAARKAPARKRGQA